MTGIEISFWICAFILIYTHVGYGVLLYFLVRIKKVFVKETKHSLGEHLPTVTFIVAAYNEEDWIIDKIKNCLSLEYPQSKIEYWFVTDGSDDSTPQLIEDFPTPKGTVVRLFHKPQRKGKIAAVDRIMPFVKSEITIYTDANTDVNPEAIKNIVRHYANPKVGAVAGEKRVTIGSMGDATGAGESIYWKYESTLKKWDSELYSAIGAAGELFSIRTKLYQSVEKDTFIEDFVMTMNIAWQGFKIVYEPNAYASEGQSASMDEELKRKIRIAAGGLQAFWRLRNLLIPFKNPVLTFQYISHRVLRWTVAPLCLPIIFVLNIYIFSKSNHHPIYSLLMYFQVGFYMFAILGYFLEQQKLKLKAFFIPYYFCFMNYAMYRGFFRLLQGRQSVKWEKAKRSIS